MKRFQIRRSILSATVISAAVILVQATLLDVCLIDCRLVAEERNVANESPVDLPSIVSTWDGYRSSITTVKIRPRVSTGSDVEKKDLQPEQICKLIEELPDANPAERVIAFLNHVAPILVERNRNFTGPGTWNLSEQEVLLHNGIDERCTGEMYDHLKVGEFHLMKRFASEEPQTAVLIRAYDRDRTRWGYNTLESYLPISGLDEFRDPEQISLTGEEIELRLKSGSRVLVDKQHYLPTLVEWRASPDTPITELRYFRNYTLFPGDVLFPMEHYRISFDQSGSPKRYWVKIIESALFNEEINDAEFRMAANEGDLSIDYRKNPDGVGHKLKQKFTDISEHFLAVKATAGLGNRRSTMSPDISNSPVMGWKSFLLILNGIVLMVIGIVLWRRQV